MWRTANGCGCGIGVGCDHGQPTPICVVQGEPVVLTLLASSPVAGQPVRAEVRAAPTGGRLLLDMGPYCSATPDDPAALLIDVPGEVTAGMRSSGYWDAWVGDERVGWGTFVLEFAVSRSPGRVALAGAWTPSLVAGSPFAREVSLDGLLPEGERVAGEPHLMVEGLDGALVFTTDGGAAVTVSGDGDSLVVALSESDTAAIGVGRFTYRLGVVNQFGEPRVVLAGMMLISSGGGG